MRENVILSRHFNLLILLLLHNSAPIHSYESAFIVCACLCLSACAFVWRRRLSSINFKKYARETVIQTQSPTYKLIHGDEDEPPKRARPPPTSPFDKSNEPPPPTTVFGRPKQAPAPAAAPAKPPQQGESGDLSLAQPLHPHSSLVVFFFAPTKHPLSLLHSPLPPWLRQCAASAVPSVEWCALHAHLPPPHPDS